MTIWSNGQTDLHLPHSDHFFSALNLGQQRLRAEYLKRGCQWPVFIHSSPEFTCA